MNLEIKKILSNCNFFRPIAINPLTNVSLQKPSLIILNNIRSQFLQFTHAKTNKSIPIYLIKEHKKQKVPYGLIEPTSIPNKIILNQDDYKVIDPTELNLHLVYPKQDIMQYFIKWQRYRKYWWSCMTTTPSLFIINDMKQENNIINVNIVANFPWGQQTVENIKLSTADNNSNEKSYLVCKVGLETALFTIMLDASSNGTKEGYVRLHNKLAPYKFSFAFNLQEDPKLNKTLIDLAKLVNCKLARKKICTWLPEFSLELQDQMKENLQMGIPYTILLDEVTLQNGILHLMNSSTMLKEQIHIADLESYAQILCKN